MTENMDKKKFMDEELDAVNGGFRRETMQVVELYNQYNPDNQYEGYCPPVLAWVYEVWGCKYPNGNAQGERPYIHPKDGSNTYELPGYGKVGHGMFMKLTAERAAAMKLQKEGNPL